MSSSCSVVIPICSAFCISRNARATSLPTARMPARSDFDSIVIVRSSERHGSFAHHYGLATDARCGHGAVLLVGFDFEDARTSHLEALFDDPAQRSVEAGIAIREIAAERDAGAARRRVFRNTDPR